MSYYWNLSDVILMIRLDLCVWGKKTMEVKYHFHWILSRVHIINIIMNVDVHSYYLVRLCLSDYSTVNLLFSYCQCFPICVSTLWKKVTMWSWHWRSGELCFHSLREELLGILLHRRLLGILLHRRFVPKITWNSPAQKICPFLPIIYLFNHLFQQDSCVDIYFIL